ncbi:hypothetical protein ACIBCH_09860 [Amycolatopsis thailandensis]|uniref:VG15 protein n=1 Tax=Amycolatopsis thailandensis TaxID=589330 RepID=UPI0037BCDD40
MSAADVAAEHYTERQDIAAEVVDAGLAMWQQVSFTDLAGSWARLMARMIVVLRAGQLAAASAAEEFVDSALEEQGTRERRVGRTRATAFSGVASDGRDLESLLLLNPVVATKVAIRDGETRERALASGYASLEMLLRTQVADAGRVADGVAVTTRENVKWVRMLVPPGDCSRCVILAGRVYRYSDGFERHPNCNCIHVPIYSEDAARSEGLISDPKEAFDAMSEAEQDRIFTRDGAQAIRDGADMNQVVNARRGAAGMAPAGARITDEEKRAIYGGRSRLRTTNVFGQELFITSEGTTRRGIAGKRLIARRGETQTQDAGTVTRLSRDGAVQRTVSRRRAQVPRLMPESIYQLATSREDAQRLLKLYGYIV